MVSRMICLPLWRLLGIRELLIGNSLSATPQLSNKELRSIAAIASAMTGGFRSAKLRSFEVSLSAWAYLLPVYAIERGWVDTGTGSWFR